MGISNKELLTYLSTILRPEKIHDYCPNGLQIEGKNQISKLITGVTASEALIDSAIEQNADAILVHHGYFWKGENPCVTGMKRRRFKKILSHDINLFAYHLPLDVHPELGNNAQLAQRLGIQVVGGLDTTNSTSVPMHGVFKTPISPEGLSNRIAEKLERQPLFELGATQMIKSVAWCTGGGQNYIDLAAEHGIDAYITGEVSEQTIHTAREMGIHFFAAGHHATERYGAKALGEHLANQFEVEVIFIDIDNPA